MKHTNNDKYIQALLFEKVQNCLLGHQSLVNEVSDILNISTDSTYRRIRGTTSLTAEEIVTLCTHFTISFDSLFGKTPNTVSFTYNPLQNEESLYHHLLFIKKQLALFQSTPDIEFIYGAIDIPIYHHFGFRGVMAFKIFYWLKGIINLKEYAHQKFSRDILDDETFNEVKEVVDMYKNFKSTEIWTHTTVNSLIKQISYYWESGWFETKEDALWVCDETEKEILNVEKIAATGSKNGTEQNFKLYFSELEITNNTVLAISKNYRRIYISHNTINIIVTSHETFCNETVCWLNNLIQKSTLISGTSEKIRYQFFKHAIDEIAQLRSYIKNS
ncbi:MAG: hypothetical protein R6U95_08015 [Bacteroidales bacterium]